MPCERWRPGDVQQPEEHSSKSPFDIDAVLGSAQEQLLDMARRRYVRPYTQGLMSQQIWYCNGDNPMLKRHAAACFILIIVDGT